MATKVVSSLVLSACVLSTGCASFQANNLPEISDSQYYSSTPEKTKVYSTWSFETGNSLLNESAAAAGHQNAFEKVMRESGCCEIVAQAADANLVIDGKVVDHSSAAALIPAYITGYSLYTIPSWVTETVDLRVSAEFGEKKNSYELSDSFKMVQWLPMIFAFPFTGGPGDNAERLKSNTYKNLLVELRKDGFIDN